MTILHLGITSGLVALSRRTPRVSGIREPPLPPSASFLPCVLSLRTWPRLQCVINFEHTYVMLYLAHTIIAKVAVQDCCQHQTFIQEVVDTFLIGLDANHAMLCKRP